MEVLKFTATGLGATFTRPSFNSMKSTYSHIHKITILGILGAVIGIEISKDIGIPKFYSELENIRVAIIPKKVSFSKEIIKITDTTGFSNKSENGGGETYIETSQLLVNPTWDIYILGSNNKHYDKIKDYILHYKNKYRPYFGKNHLFAHIKNMELLDGILVKNVDKVDSLFSSKYVKTEEDEFSLEDRYYFSEYMPVSLHRKLYQYWEEKLVFTNDKVVDSTCNFLSCDNKILYLI